MNRMTRRKIPTHTAGLVVTPAVHCRDVSGYFTSARYFGLNWKRNSDATATSSAAQLMAYVNLCTSAFGPIATE
jgi:hypothetical protein